MKAKMQPIRAMQIGFGAALAVLIVVGMAAYRGVIESNKSSRWTQHTYQVLEHIASLRSTMASIASGPLTDKELRTLIALTADNPEQQRRLGILAGLVQQTIQSGDTVNRLPRLRGPEPASGDIRKVPADPILDKVRSVIADMDREERRLLLERSADQARR